MPHRFLSQPKHLASIVESMYNFVKEGNERFNDCFGKTVKQAFEGYDSSSVIDDPSSIQEVLCHIFGIKEYQYQQILTSLEVHNKASMVMHQAKASLAKWDKEIQNFINDYANILQSDTELSEEFECKINKRSEYTDIIDQSSKYADASQFSVILMKHIVQIVSAIVCEARKSYIAKKMSIYGDWDEENTLVNPVIFLQWLLERNYTLPAPILLWLREQNGTNISAIAAETPLCPIADRTRADTLSQEQRKSMWEAAIAESTSPVEKKTLRTMLLRSEGKLWKEIAVIMQRDVRTLQRWIGGNKGDALRIQKKLPPP